MGDKGRQELGKVDTPSNTGRQGETRPREGIHTIQNMQGDNGRQNGEIRRREGGRTTQHRQTRQDTIQHRHTCGETIGNKKGRQDVDKADPPSNTGTCVGRQWEAMGLMGEKGRQDVREGGHTIQYRHTCGETMIDNGGPWGTRCQAGGRTIQYKQACGKPLGNIGRQGGDKTPRRQTHYPTQAHMWGDNGRQVETRCREGGHTNQQEETRRETLGDKGRQDEGGRLKNALRTARAVRCLEDKQGR